MKNSKQRQTKKIIIFLKSGKTVVISWPQLVIQKPSPFPGYIDEDRPHIILKNRDNQQTSVEKLKSFQNEYHLLYMDQIAGITFV